MAPERDRPSVDRVREQLRRGERPDSEWEPDTGPDPERVTEQQERVKEPDPPRE
jgi:hypothetical protein